MSTTRPCSGIVSSDEPDDLIFSVKSDERWMAAVHEAGHAVIARLVGYSVVEVGIENDRYRCNAKSDPLKYDEANDAIYTLAGEKAENAVLASHGETLLSDIDRKHFLGLGPGAATSDERGAWREAIERRVESYIANERDAIEAVARRLVRPPYRLTGEEVREIATASVSPVR